MITVCCELSASNIKGILSANDSLYCSFLYLLAGIVARICFIFSLLVNFSSVKSLYIKSLVKEKKSNLSSGITCQFL